MRPHAIVVSLLVALGSPAQARYTGQCNTSDTNSVLFYGMTEQTQARLSDAYELRQHEPELYEHLWQPLKATTITTVLGNRMVLLWFDPFQDIPEIVQSMRSDPVVNGLGIGSIDGNGGWCFGAMPPPSIETAVEYRNNLNGHYYISTNAADEAVMDSGAGGPGWERTGEVFHFVGPSGCYRMQPVFRFFHPGSNSHFLTADAAECGWLRRVDPGWIPEDIWLGATLPVGGACPYPGLTPVYRAYNNRWMFDDSNHRYTVKAEVYQEMIAKGWIGEGVRMCVRER